MKKCKFEGCGRKTWKKSEWCIFHEPGKEKDADLFWVELVEMLEEKNYNFKGFCFIPKRGKDAIDFQKVVFGTNVDFSNAKFHEVVWFHETTFRGDAIFAKSEFLKHVWFTYTDFYQDSIFDFAEFLENAFFDETRFNKKTSFAGVRFSHDVLFDMASFHDDVSFFNTIFSGTISFYMAKILGCALFNNAQFLKNSYWEKAKFEKVDFRNILFKNPEQAKFYHTDLSKALFSPTSGLERIDFLNPKWAGEKRKEIFPGDDHLGTTDIDEKYSELETMYRQLKRNYENKRNYPDAGDFYIGEMEMRRKNRKTSWLERKMILPFYKIVSNYGESYGRMFLWILGFIIFSNLLLLISGENNIINVSLNVIRAITLQPLQGVNESKNNTILAIFTFIRILGILFVALFTLALRRRFRR